MIGRPARDETAEYYFRYIDQVTAPDILGFLAEQQTERRGSGASRKWSATSTTPSVRGAG